MLRLGYAVMLVAVAAVVGYGAFHVIRAIVVSPHIGLFFKILIPVATVGVLLTIAGLICERVKEERNAHHDD